MTNALAAAEFPGWAGKLPPGSAAEPIAIASIPGWRVDDHREAFSAFLNGCASIVQAGTPLRAARPSPEPLRRVCAAALELAERLKNDAAGCAEFFERHFQAFDIRPEGGSGFLTAYFEPEVAASRQQSADFPIPVLARPEDLFTIAEGEPRPAGLDPKLAAARRAGAGFEPYPDRAAIWGGALGERARPIAWLRDETELFIVQVQGSARLAFKDGTRARLTYAGRNGHPYTSIGRLLVESGEIALEQMSLERLMAWLRADPARGRSLMERNRSYIFFALEPLNDPARGPIGGAGVPLKAGRSLAIDRAIWPYGLPVWIAAAPLTPEGDRRALDRLMIAQDTGSAIIGAARADFFMGTGAGAGSRAGLVRDPLRFILFLPHER